MSTKTKNDKYSFNEQCFTTSENQCYNLNLNQSKKYPILIPVQSYNKPNNDKYCAATNFIVTDKEKEKLQLRNESFKISTFPTINEDDLIKQRNNASTLKSTNKSTLSLHIEAHENSIEAVALDLFHYENIERLKKETNNSKSRNPFEFPRQQNGDQRNIPEIMQLKTSQKLLGSNQPSSSQKTGNNDGFMVQPEMSPGAGTALLISIIATLFFISTFICGQKREPPRPNSKRSKKAATNQSNRPTASRSQPKSSSSPIQNSASDGACPKSNNKLQGSDGGGNTGEKPTTTTTTTTEQQSDETKQSVDQSVDKKSIDNKKPETRKKKSVRSIENPVAADKNKQKGVKSVKEKILIRNETQSNRSTKTARQQQQQSSTRAASTQQPTSSTRVASTQQLSSSNRVATTQRSTKDDDHRPSQKQKSADEIVQPSSRRIPAIPPPRDSERDKQIAAKALKFIRARRAQNNFSTRERNYESSSSLKEEKEPGVQDNAVEGQILSADEGNNSKNKSASLPSGETPEAGQKIGGVEEIEKEAVDEETKKEIQQHHAQAGIYVPPEKRQFRPCSEIPSDDLTVKREVRKKKKKQKKKSKKKSNSSSDDKNNKEE